MLIGQDCGLHVLTAPHIAVKIVSQRSAANNANSAKMWQTGMRYKSAISSRLPQANSRRARKHMRHRMSHLPTNPTQKRKDEGRPPGGVGDALVRLVLVAAAGVLRYGRPSVRQPRRHAAQPAEVLQ